MAIKADFKGCKIYPPSGCGNYVPSLNIDTAQGQELDRIAELWGLKRNHAPDPHVPGGVIWESDGEVRYRIRNMAMGDSGGGYVDPNAILLDLDDDKTEPCFEIPDNRGKFLRMPKCECGAASLGYSQPGPGHASWCPIATV